MSAIREVYLSLREVEDYVRRFEEKYKMSSAEFLRNAEQHTEVSEDDVFQWEAFIDHRRELRSIDEQVHRHYLKTLKHAPRETGRPSGFVQVCVAA